MIEHSEDGASASISIAEAAEIQKRMAVNRRSSSLLDFEDSMPASSDEEGEGDAECHSED